MRAHALLWTLLSALAAFICLTGGGQSAESSAEENREALLPGYQYMVRAERRGLGPKFSGQLVEANQRWVLLRCSSELHQPRQSMLDKLPIFGRRPESEAIGLVEEFVWIPREALIVVSRKASAEKAAMARSDETRPPSQTACQVQFVRGSRVQQFDGGLEQIDDNQLTVSVPKRVKTYAPLPTSPGSLMSLAGLSGLARYENRCSREEIAVSDVICVRVTKVKPDSVGDR